MPPRVKVLEALGAIADSRVELVRDGARVWSSSRGKAYNVRTGRTWAELTSNDNGSYHRGYLGYPAIAFLMESGHLDFDGAVAGWLRGVRWKDLNVETGYDYSETERRIGVEVEARGGSARDLRLEVDRVLQTLASLDLERLASDDLPPAGY